MNDLSSATTIDGRRLAPARRVPRAAPHEFAKALAAATAARRQRRKDALQAQRRRLLAAEPWCQYCGVPLTKKTATLDHIRPRHRFGSDHPENLWLACGPCNTFKGCHRLESLACPRVRGGKLRFVSDLFLEGRHTMSATILGFNYDALEEAVRAKAKEHAGKIQKLLKTSTTAVVEIGRRLIEVHEALGRNSYSAWLKAEFRWSQSVASNYESIARKFGDSKSLDNFQPSALAVLCRANIDPRAVTEAKKRADAGVIVSRQEAVKVIRHFLPAGESHPVLNDAIHHLRSAVKKLMQLPPAKRREVADELLELAAQLRSGRKATGESAASERAQPAAPVEAPAPAPRLRGRRRELAVA